MSIPLLFIYVSAGGLSLSFWFRCTFIVVYIMRISSMLYSPPPQRLYPAGDLYQHFFLLCQRKPRAFRRSLCGFVSPVIHTKHPMILISMPSSFKSTAINHWNSCGVSRVSFSYVSPPFFG